MSYTVHTTTSTVAHRVSNDALVHAVAIFHHEWTIGDTSSDRTAASVTTLCGIARDGFEPVDEPVTCLPCLALAQPPTKKVT